MRVGDKHLRIHPGKCPQVLLCRVERRQRREVVHVADVLAQPGVLSVGDRQCVFEVGADRKGRRQRQRQRDGQWRVSAGAPDRQLDGLIPIVGTADRYHAHDGVVAGHEDRAVVHQPAVGQLRKPFQCIIIGEADRLSAEVARCHHECCGAGLVTGQPEEQRVQWRVGEHDAEVRIVGGHGIRHRGVLPARHQHDRPLWTGQQARGPVIDLGEGVRSRQVGHHHRERFVAAPLSCAQLCHRTLVGGVAGEVVSADALDRDDAAVAQQSPCLTKRSLGFGRPAVAVSVAQCGSAPWTADGLGMESPIGGVAVFAGAFGAHREGRHGRRRSVVGQGGNDGEPRAAVGAVDECVPVTPVGRITLFGGAFGAHGDVGGGQGAAAGRS